MADIERFFQLAVEDRLISRREADRLIKKLQDRGAGLSEAANLLSRSTHVTPMDADRLRRRALGEDVPPRPKKPSGRVIGKPSGRVIGKASGRPIGKGGGGQGGAHRIAAAGAVGLSLPRGAGAGKRPARGQPLEKRPTEETPPPGPPKKGTLSHRDPSQADAVLIVLPPGAKQLDPTKPQVQAYSQVLGLGLYDARLQLREPLPRLVQIGEPATIRKAADQLQASGLDCLCLGATAVLGKLEFYRVKQIEVEPDAWVFSGPGGSTRLPLQDPALLIVGRYDTRATGSLTVDYRTYRGEAMDMVPFAHLYLPEDEVPYEIILSDIKSYEFLGPEKSVSAQTNFRRLLDLLAEEPGVMRNDYLYQHAGRMKNMTTATGGSGGMHGGIGYTLNERTNQQNADMLSRVMFYGWKQLFGD